MTKRKHLIQQAFKPGPDTALDFRERMDQWLDALDRTRVFPVHYYCGDFETVCIIPDLYEPTNRTRTRKTASH